MLIGQLLVSDGIITAAQLETGLQVQARFGGRLGSGLVELGFLDLDKLARALGKLRRIAPVLPKHVANIDPDALALLTPAKADHYGAIPLGNSAKNPQRLIVALREPSMKILEELAFITGRRIEAGVAPELLIFRLLERCYGIKRRLPYVRAELDKMLAPGQPSAEKSASSAGPPSHRTPAVVPTATPSAPGFAESDAAPASIGPIMNQQLRRAAQEAAAGMGVDDLPPLPGRPKARSFSPIPFVPYVSMTPPPPPRPVAPSPPRAPASNPGPLSERNGARALQPPPVAAPPAFTPAAPLVAPTPPRSAPNRRPALGATDAIARIVASRTRDDIGDGIVDYLRSAFGCGLVLIIRDDVALGWKGFADTADDAAVESVSIPLGSASMLKAAHLAQSLFRGAPSADGAPLNSRLWKLLRTPPPLEVIVAPVLLGKRVVNLIYAHAFDAGILPASATADLVRVCAAAADAYTAVIRKK